MNRRVGGTVALDLGSSNSTAATYLNGQAVVVPSAQGGSMFGKNTPSYIYYSAAQGLKIGVAAKDMLATEPECVAYEFKRWLGRNDPSTGDAKVWVLDGRVFTAAQLIGILARHLVHESQQFLDARVDNVLLTVPAYFSDPQINELKLAVETFVRPINERAVDDQGIKVIRVERQPTAAAIAYDPSGKKDCTLAVLDMGGGTFDVSLIRLESGVYVVKGLGGDSRLGGQDIDQLLVKHVLAELASNNINISKEKTPVEYAEVRLEVEKAKVRLSHLESTEVSFRNLGYDEVARRPLSHSMRLSRAMLDTLLAPLIPRLDACVDESFAHSDLKKSDITGILLVGGPAHMKWMRDYASTRFGKPILGGINATECVALGGALLASSITGENSETQVHLVNSTPMHLGIEVYGGRLQTIIPKGTSYPTEKTQTFSTVEDYQSNVEIKIYEGMRPRAQDNVLLGQFHLDGLQKKPRGQAHVQVTFRLDSDGLLHVSARDSAGSKSSSLNVSREGKISQELIEQMTKAAAENADSDAEFLKRSKLKDKISHAEFSLKSLKSSAPKQYTVLPEEMEEIDRLLQECTRAQGLDNLQDLEKLTEQLQSAVGKLYAAVYSDARKTSPVEQSTTQPTDSPTTE